MNRTFGRLAAGLPLAIGLAAGGFVAPATATTAASAAITARTGAAVVIRHAVLWSSSASGAARRGAVEPGDIVTLLPRGHRNAYLHVQTQDEEVGWISDRVVRAIDEADVHHPGALITPAPTGPTTPAGGAITGGTPPLAVTAAVFDGCPVTGSPSPNGSRYQELLALNTLKNRSAEPVDVDVDKTVTLDKILQPTSDDEHRFSTGRAAEVTAYVYHVKPGGTTETTNCGKKGTHPDAAHIDTHIELVSSPSDTMPARRFIVEVTPRWRAAAAAMGIDWSTLTLQQTIEKHWVRVRGWLFFDAEHTNASESTNPGNISNWRATPWEIHPIVSMAVVPQP